jgi:hypothetical protein
MTTRKWTHTRACARIAADSKRARKAFEAKVAARIAAENKLRDALAAIDAKSYAKLARRAA